jgi:hypothetical protein
LLWQKHVIQPLSQGKIVIFLMRDFAALLISIMRSVHKKIVIVAGFSENFDIFVIIKLFGFFHLQIFCIKLLMAGPFAKNVTQK